MTPSNPSSMLPETLDLPALGLDPESVIAVAELRRRPTHGVLRVTHAHGSDIVKWFAGTGPFPELEAYALLARLGVPTLPVRGRSANALRIADLAASPTWRQATGQDNEDPTCGVAVAHWYRRLHAVGLHYLAELDATRWPFRPWIDRVDAAHVSQAATVLGLRDAQAIQTALDALPTIVTAYRRRPQTLNYQDFALENLALSRSATERRAVVFDYDCLTIGTAYGDWRNVMSGLTGAAASAFAAAYGPVHPGEACLDRPLSLLEGLILASRRPSLPSWARPLIAAVRDGTLARDIDAALICAKEYTDATTHPGQ